MLIQQNVGPPLQSLMPAEMFRTKIEKLLDSFSQKKKSQQTFLYASLNSGMRFKIQPKFSRTHIFLTGSLEHLNGKPVSVPQIYSESLIRQLQGSPKRNIKFQILPDSGIFIFKSGFKIQESDSNLVSIFIEHFQLIISNFPQIQQQLVNFWIIVKNCRVRINTLKQKLTLLRQTTKIITKPLDPIQLYEDSSSSSKTMKKGSVFKFYNHIQEIQNLAIQKRIETENLKENNVLQGGYFEVQKKKIKLTQNQTQCGQLRTMCLDLAVKTLRNDQANLPYCQQKLQKQYKILQEIEDPTYSLDYWVESKNLGSQKQNDENGSNSPKNDKMIMEFVEESLCDYIYGRPNSVKEILNFSSQLIEGVSVLQNSGIIHRDLKPENILIQTETSSNSQIKKRLKIIDFGQSSLKTQSFSNKTEDLLGSTLPYSPIECFLACEEGYNSIQIDLWSVGMIIYEMFNRKNPVSYSRCFASDIYRGWRMPGEFSVYPRLHKKAGIRAIETVINYLTINSVCPVQRERLSLKKMGCLIGLIKDYLDELLSL